MATLPETDNIALYLNDHLGGSAAALQLLDSLTEDADPKLAELLEAIQAEIMEDREVLLGIMHSLDVEPGTVKQAAGRIAGAAMRLQASEAVTHSAELSRLLRLERLVLGISGKIAGWTALGATQDPRLVGVDIDALVERARSQLIRLEPYRLGAAAAALRA
jgi:hypothetical protein